MLILFDHGTPKVSSRRLPDTKSSQPREEVGDKFDNGALLNAAEDAGVELLLTTDGRIRYQQNLAKTKDRSGCSDRTTNGQASDCIFNA